MPPIDNEAGEATTSLRDVLESAYDEAASTEEGRPTENAPEPVRTANEAPATDTPAVTPDADRGDGRRADGKFARQKPAAPDSGGAGAAGADGKPAAAAPVATPADDFAKAPQSWKPGAREAWGSLPADVRAEVHRREREAAHVMQETAQARQVHTYVNQLQQQFAPALAAENVNVLEAASNLMGLASRLRFGTAAEKAQLTAQIVQSYGVDITALDNALAGLPPVPQGRQAPGIEQFRDPRLDELLATLQQTRQQREAAAAQEAVKEVETFGSGKEFFADVREDMADILEVAARRGFDMSLEDAYNRACSMNPDISKVLAARQAAGAAGTNRSTQQARRAATSVRGTPGNGGSTPQPNDLRGAIEAAIENVGGR